jgi:chromate reductase
MKPYTIAVLVGSLRKESYNKKLAIAMMKLAPADLNFKQVELGVLPLYNQEDEGAPSAAVKDFRAEIAAAEGLLFVTPEYNRSIPGVLKNALDQGSRPAGQNAWAGKPAGILGISVGMMGTSMAQQHLRNILAFLDVPVLAQPEVFLQYKEGLFDETGSIGEASRQFLQNWMNKYAAWIRKFNV